MLIEHRAGLPSLLSWHRDRRAHSVSVMNTNPNTLLLAAAQPQRSTTTCSPVIKLPTVLIRRVKLRFVSCWNVQLDPSPEQRHPLRLKYNWVIHLVQFWLEGQDSGPDFKENEPTRHLQHAFFYLGSNMTAAMKKKKITNLYRLIRISKLLAGQHWFGWMNNLL